MLIFLRVQKQNLTIIIFSFGYTPIEILQFAATAEASFLGGSLSVDAVSKTKWSA
jgi:hypothetical protein